MAKTLTDKDNQFVIQYLNTAELQQLFTELADNVQMKILNTAFRKAGKTILDSAKENFNASKKNKSKTGYNDLEKSFKMKPFKRVVGMLIGMEHKEGYKYRFINYGTKEREYKIGKSFKSFAGVKGFYKSDKLTHSTGIIKPSEFFTKAVESQGDKAQNMLADEINLSMEKTIKRYEKNASK